MRYRITTFLAAILLPFISSFCLAVPAATTLNYDTDGIQLSLYWNQVPNATGYRLYYAPSPYAGPETVETIDMGAATEIGGDLWLGAAFYIAIKAYDDSGEGELSNVQLVEMTEANMYSDYVRNADIQNDEWDQYVGVLDQIAPYYEGLPLTLNTEPVWFKSLNIDPSHFSSQEHWFEVDGNPMGGVGFGNYLTENNTELVFYSNWVPLEPNAGSAYVLEYVDGTPISLEYMGIDGAPHSQIVEYKDGSKDVFFVGHDEGSLSGESPTTDAAMIGYDVQLRTFFDSGWITGAHDSTVFDFDNDGDTDLFGVAGNNWLLKNNDGEFELIEFLYSGSTMTPVETNANDELLIFTGDAGKHSEGIRDTNVLQLFSINDLDSTLISETETPIAYFNRPEFADIEVVSGDDISHDVDSLAADIDYDGDVDIIVGSIVWSNSNPYSVAQILINEGGEYVDETDSRLFNWLLVGGGTHKLSLVDVNEDGYLDLLTSDEGYPWRFHDWTIEGSYLSSAKVLINDGTGHFVTTIHQQINHPTDHHPSHIPSLSSDKELRWSVIRAQEPGHIEPTPDNKVRVLTRNLDVKLSTGPNGIDPAQYGAPGFNEFYYLLYNEDVADAVANGIYISGLAHYLDSGRAEGRAGNARE